MNIFIFSKDDSQILKGGAICLMIWHHVFGCYNIDPVVIKDVQWVQQWSSMAASGRVCVSLFLFVSGYGLACKMTESRLWYAPLQTAWKMWSKFYLIYLFCFILASFIFYLSPDLYNNPLPHTLKAWLLGVTSIVPAYSDWWYASLFLGVCWVVYPFSHYWRRILSTKGCVYIHCMFAVVFSLGVYFVLRIPECSNGIVVKIVRWLPVYFMAYATGVMGMPGKCADKKVGMILLLSFFCCCVLNIQFFLLMTILAFLFPVVVKLLNINVLFVLLGKYSVWMWLSHRFVFGYHFSGFFYKFNPWVITLVTVIVSFMVSVVLDYVFKKIISGVMYVSNKLKYMPVNPS